MKWLTFAVLAWIFLGLELGLRDALRLGHGQVSPSFVFVLLAFFALVAPAKTAGWCAVVLGLLMDMTNQLTFRGRGEPLAALGPHVAAYLPAVYLILSLRGVVMKRNPLALGFLSAAGSLVSGAVLLAIFTLRSAYEPLAWSASEQVFARLGSAMYTGLVAIPLALVLLPAAPLLGVPSPQQRRFSRV